MGRVLVWVTNYAFDKIKKVTFLLVLPKSLVAVTEVGMISHHSVRSRDVRL